MAQFRLLPWLPRNRFGALVSRELRYWWRETRRRASLITFAVVGVFLPVMVNLSSVNDKPVPAAMQLLSMVGVGTLASVAIANQFGYDGTAYATHVVMGVPGRLELRARAVAYSWLIVPILLGLAALTAVLQGDPTRCPRCSRPPVRRIRHRPGLLPAHLGLGRLRAAGDAQPVRDQHRRRRRQEHARDGGAVRRCRLPIPGLICWCCSAARSGPP